MHIQYIYATVLLLSPAEQSVTIFQQQRVGKNKTNTIHHTTPGPRRAMHARQDKVVHLQIIADFVRVWLLRPASHPLYPYPRPSTIAHPKTTRKGFLLSLDTTCPTMNVPGLTRIRHCITTQVGTAYSTSTSLKKKRQGKSSRLSLDESSYYDQMSRGWTDRSN